MRALGENFKQTLKLEAVKVAARLPAKLCVVRAGVSMGTWSPVTKCQRTGDDPCSVSVGISGTSEEIVDRDMTRRLTRIQVRSKSWGEKCDHWQWGIYEHC